MSQTAQRLEQAFARAQSLRSSEGGGFPILAEVLRQAGVERNVWHLPSAQSLYQGRFGTVIQQGPPLVQGMVEVPAFDEAALIAALRKDQSGQSTFPAFLAAAWAAGVIGYEIDFLQRTCTYCGCKGEIYVESYPAVRV